MGIDDVDWQMWVSNLMPVDVSHGCSLQSVSQKRGCLKLGDIPGTAAHSQVVAIASGLTESSPWRMRRAGVGRVRVSKTCQASEAPYGLPGRDRYPNAGQ
jgi:hypothetical protein